MKNLLTLLFVVCIISSCSLDPFGDDSSEDGIYDAPSVGSYVTYISQNAATLNGFINYENIAFLESDTYQVGFTFRKGDKDDASNDQIIVLEEEIPYFTGTYSFNYDIDSLEPNTTYHYAAQTKNGSSEREHWQSFTTSEIPCDYEKDNYYSFDGTWKDAYVRIDDPSCCDEGNVGFTFGTWPNTFEISFNEKKNGYPKTGQYFGVDYRFDIGHIQRELVQSTNQVLMDYSDSTSETELFVNNDGERITLIFCNTMLRDGTILNGKVSVAIPEN